VYREIAVGGERLAVAQCVQGAIASWLSGKDVVSATAVERLLHAGLHPGESEAIVLATELASTALLMDDGDGIKSALAVGANVIRTPGIYRLAKNTGLVKAVRPKLDHLRNAGFWLRDEHYRKILESVGE
jgi:predicted nucleic acid-binding protein